MRKRFAYAAQPILRVMKLTTVIMTTFLLQVSAAGYAQKITLSKNNASLKEVFKEIRKQSGYDFVYTTDQIRLAKNVDIHVADAQLADVLQQCFAGQPFTYKIEQNTIIVLSSAIKAEFPVTLDISGKVLDENDKPIPGANVYVRESRGIRTSTGANGEFRLRLVPEKATLVISYVGYIIQEIPVKPDQGYLTVKMVVNQNAMKEVVITTGIFRKSAESYTGSSTTVTAKELQQFGNRNLITSLRNIDPSFNIIESNTFGSDPNRIPEIQIRGNSSVPNVDQLKDQTRVGLNTPLVILDGFESTLQKLLDINENEVESLTILKDASATAIYGSRGSNGVIVITTRAPRPGKLRLSYRADLNIENPDLSAYNLLDARDKLDLELKAGYYNNARAETDLPLKRYYNYLLNEVNRGVNTDWLSIPLRTGVGQRHNLRLEGGDQSFRYSASAQVNDIEGTMKGSARKTFNGNITLSYIYQNVRFKNNLQISQGKSNVSPYGTFSDYAKMNPYWTAYDASGNVLKQLGYPGNTDYSNYWTTLPANPLYNATLNGFNKTATSELTNNTSVEWTILKDILLRAQVGLTKGFVQTDVFRSADNTAFANYTDIDIFRKGDYNYGVTNALNYDGSLNLSYNKTFAGKHVLFAGFDYNMRQNKSSYTNFVVEGFNNPNFDFISTALQYQQNGKPTGGEALTRSVGMTGNVNYIYDNRYFADVSVRVDGSSQFGSSKRFAPFWSTGLGWNIHNEDFLAGNKIVNRLKLRGSMGITGSQNFDAYQALSTYGYYSGDRYFNWNGAYLLGLGNEDLQWQQAMKYDIGIDAEFLERRLRLTADYYQETTNDLISSVNLPASSGFTSYIDNIGKLRNKGYELKATGYLISHPKTGFFWSVTAALIHNKNKVIETSRALKDAQKSIQNATSIGQLYIDGYSSNAIWVVPSLGIDPSTGKELYLDRNGNPTYTWNGADVTAVGSTDPKALGNLSSMVRYKTLSLNVAFGYRFGGQMYNQTLIDKVETGNYKYNVDARVYDSRWQNPGDNAAFKGLLVTTPTYKTSRFVQNENTINCQNINLQYDVKSKYIIKNLGLESLSFSANVADAFYFSTVKQERGTSYPFSRQFSLNVNAIF